MSHYRRLSGGKRDSNEPQIIRRFDRHGWHVEQLSGTAIPDLLCWPMNPRSLTTDSEGLAASVLVDVKEPKGTTTPAQVEKWRALAAKGIPVYVARTEVDVDAIVAGTARPWGVTEVTPRRGKALAKVEADAGNRLRVVREPGAGQKRAPRPAYEAPAPRGSRTNPLATKAMEPSNAAEHRALLAAREAEEAFAPAPEESAAVQAARLAAEEGLPVRFVPMDEPCWHNGSGSTPGPCRNNTAECHTVGGRL